MASAVSTYDERLRLVDSFGEYKFYFSKAHFLFLVQESLELAQGGAEKLRYILGLASRCKAGVVSIELLAKQIDNEYSPQPLLREREGGVREDQEQEWEGMETDNDEGDNQQAQQQDDGEEEEAPHAYDEVNKLIETFGSSFFSRRRWPVVRTPFLVPGEGHLLDAHDIEKLRTSTSVDFASATPKPMSACLNGDSRRRNVPESVFRNQEKSYQLCKRVAVSFDGKIYRATDAEIETALKNEKSAPSCSVGTYVKAVQETRRQHAVMRARQSGNG